MNTIKVAFFKGKGSVLSETIRTVTHSKYSHTEIIIDEYWYGANINFLKGSGVIKVKQSDMDVKEDEWDVMDIDVTDEEYVGIKNKLDSLVGRSYNFEGIVLTQMFGIIKKTKEEFFCSEMVAYVLLTNHILKLKTLSVNYHPGLLWEELNNKSKYTQKRYLKIRRGSLPKNNKVGLEDNNYNNDLFLKEW